MSKNYFFELKIDFIKLTADNIVPSSQPTSSSINRSSECIDGTKLHGLCKLKSWTLSAFVSSSGGDNLVVAVLEFVRMVWGLQIGEFLSNDRRAATKQLILKIHRN